MKRAEYERIKLETAKKAFPPQERWRASDLVLRVGINYTTAERWLLRWCVAGIVRRVDKCQKLWEKGTARWWYYFP